MTQAFRCPQQWLHRIAARCRLHQRFQIVEQRRIIRDFRFSSAARLANAPVACIAVLVDLVNAAIDRATGDIRDPGNQADAAISGCNRFSRHKPPQQLLVEQRRKRLEPLSDPGFSICHASGIYLRHAAL